MLEKINNFVYCLPYEEATDRPNLFYINGDKFSIAIDAGNSKAHVEKFYNEIISMGFKLPELTIITHWHWDHTFGLKYINGKSLSSPFTKTQLDYVSHWKFTIEEMRKREETNDEIAFCNDHILVEYKELNDIQVVSTDEVTTDEYIDLGNVELHVIYMDSPHSRDSLFIECGDLLFVGDADCGDYYYNDKNYDVDKTKNMLNYFKKINPRLFLIGHGEPISYNEEIEYLNDVIANNGKVDELV